MDALLTYRDDGPLAQAIRAIAPALKVGSSAVSALGLVLLVVGLAVDGETTSAWSLGGLALFVLLGAAGGASYALPRLRWLTPPFLRAGEMGMLIVLGARGGDHALPATYALLSAVAFHHYDVVYRLRHQRVAPPAWLGRLGFGWDGRMIIVAVLSVIGALPTGVWVLAAYLGALFAVESIASWVRLARAPERVLALDEDEEEV
jgi:hypothetical protein